MIILLIVSFVLGCLYAFIRWKIEKKHTEEALAERLILEAALAEKDFNELLAMYTLFGIEKAQDVIVTNYKINHGISLKD